MRIRGTFPVLFAVMISSVAFADLQIENEYLRVSLREDRPAISRYLHKPSNLAFEGAGEAGALLVNGEAVPWSEFRLEVERIEKNPSEIPAWYRYRLSLPRMGFRFDIGILLRENSLIYQLKNIQDPDGKLQSIAWKDLPLVVCDGRDWRFWRMTAGAPDPSSGGKMWMYDQGGPVDTAQPESEPAAVIHGAVFAAEKLCVFAESNYPLLPITHQITEDKKYAIGLNTYQYRVRSRTMPPLEAQVVFLGDINKDARSDASDFAFWVNQRIPDADPIYTRSVWYKIFMDYPASPIRTTFDEAQEIVEAIYNVTDGMSQIVYLVGWQNIGHDTLYPAFDSINPRVGGATGLRNLFDTSKNKFNTTVSYHNNIDDAYLFSKDWNEAYISDNGSVSHCLEVETGYAFERLDELFRIVPHETTHHVDNTRITSVVEEKNIGVLEELVCGLQPIARYFRQHGMTLTTEGQNGVPVDCASTGLFQGFWHLDYPISSTQLWFRKIVGGSWRFKNRTGYGLGSSINSDISYRPVSREGLGQEIWDKYFTWGNPEGITSCFKTQKDWDVFVRDLYLGTFLYHFYLEHQLTNFQNVEGGYRLEFDYGKVVTTIVNDQLRVVAGDLLIAENEDRFVPRDGAIYAYSLEGCEREWALPEAFRGKALQLFTLSKEGRGEAPEYTLSKETIALKLKPKTPVKIVVVP